MALISKMLPFPLIVVASAKQHLRRGDLAAVASGRKLADATEALAVATLDEEEAELNLEKAHFNEAAAKLELYDAEHHEDVAEHKLEEAVVNKWSNEWSNEWAHAWSHEWSFHNVDVSKSEHYLEYDVTPEDDDILFPETELKQERAVVNEFPGVDKVDVSKLEHEPEDDVILTPPVSAPEIDFNDVDVIIFDDEDTAGSYVSYETPKKTSRCKQATTTTKAPTTTTTTTIAATEADEYEFDSEKGEWVQEKAVEWDSRTFPRVP